MSNATDRVDAQVEGSLVRAPSHQWAANDLAPLRSIRSHVSHHAHFATDPTQEDDQDDDEERESPPARPVVDIEHVPVDDDPREWSDKKKGLVMALMTAAVVS